MAVPLGIFLMWFGYSVGYYGWNRITGGNDSFVSLVYPGRYKYTARDNPQTQPTTPPANKPAPALAATPTKPGQYGYGVVAPGYAAKPGSVPVPQGSPGTTLDPGTPGSGQGPSGQ